MCMSHDRRMDGRTLKDTSLLDGDFVAVDIETTGPRPGSNSIIEIGAARLAGGAVVGRFGELVRPCEPIPLPIMKLTGITADMVAAAASLDEVMARFRSFSDGAVLVAHNHRFDLGFLDLAAEQRWGSPLPRPVLDTLLLARRLHPELSRFGLQTLCGFYGTTDRPDHRACTDATATAEVWARMRAELAERGIDTTRKAAGFIGLAHQGDLASKLVLTTTLPDRPGIYLMRGEEGRVLHIGRTKDLRNGVRTYFYAAPGERHYRTAMLTRSVEHIECVSPLDAILLESRLSLRYQPALDGDHERGRETAYLHLDMRSTYPRLRVLSHRCATGVNIGPITSVPSARMLVDAIRAHYGLRRCARRLGPGALARPCEHRAKDDCPHPCLGEVSRDVYAARVQAVLDVFADAGCAARLQSAFESLRECAATTQRYEEAIRYRDAQRALDRTISALRVVHASGRMPASVIIEGGADGLVIHIIRYGYLADTLRMGAEDIATGRWRYLTRMGLRAALALPASDPASDELTQRQVRDMFIIDEYREQRAPIEVCDTGGENDFTDRVIDRVERLLDSKRRRARPSAARD